MKRTRDSFAVCVALLCLLLVLPAFGDADAEAGRKTAAQWQDAVVTLQFVIKTSMSYSGEEGFKRESKSEATGAVIDPSGLVVTSLSVTSPTDVFSSMMPDSSEGKVDFSSELVDMKILLPDGQELPAKIVLRDKDLDLAFIRPKQKPAKPLAAIDLTKAAKPALLDQVIILHRLGTVASRSLAACTDRIQSVVEKPRTFYIPGVASMGASLGAPVFAMDSGPIGLLLLRTLPTKSADMSLFSGLSGMGLAYIVLPATDILEAAKQAPQSAEEAK